MFRGLSWAVVSHSDRGVPRNGNHYVQKNKRETMRNAPRVLWGVLKCPWHWKHQLYLALPPPLCQCRDPLPGSTLTASWVKNTHGQITCFSPPRFYPSLQDFKVMSVIFTVKILSAFKNCSLMELLMGNPPLSGAIKLILTLFGSINSIGFVWDNLLV